MNLDSLAVFTMVFFVLLTYLIIILAIWDIKKSAIVAFLIITVTTIGLIILGYMTIIEGLIWSFMNNGIFLTELMFIDVIIDVNYSEVDAIRDKLKKRRKRRNKDNE